MTIQMSIHAYMKGFTLYVKLLVIKSSLIHELEGEVILLPLMDRMTQKVKGGPILHLLGRTNPFGVAPK